MSTNEPTTEKAVVGIYVKEVAKVVQEALVLYESGIALEGISALFATWDMLTHRDVDLQQGLEEALMEIRATVDAIMNDEVTLEIKEA